MLLLTFKEKKMKMNQIKVNGIQQPSRAGCDLAIYSLLGSITAAECSFFTAVTGGWRMRHLASCTSKVLWFNKLKLIQSLHSTVNGADIIYHNNIRMK